MHKHWLRKDIEGWESMRANFIGMDLRNMDLNHTVLNGALFSRANLMDANFKNACLMEANFDGADLSDANFSYAQLNRASLECAQLWGANLYTADMRGANLRYTRLIKSIIYGANLCGATDVPYIPLACPSEGSFIGWKKATAVEDTPYREHYSVLVKLEIPEDAKRSSATTKKCRCDKAKVLEITNMKTGEKLNSIVNINFTECLYTVGEMVYPDSFDEDRWNECSHGIHFFTNKQDAIDYR